MPYKIALEVGGLDFDDEATLESIAQSLSDMAWTRVSGRVLATLFIDAPHPVLKAVEAAARIRHQFPYACVQRVDQDLVNVTDISQRASVTPEAVRLWVTGQRGPGHFPVPTASVGGGRKGASKIWRWADVNAWLDNHYRLGDGYKYLSDRQRAQLLVRLTQPGHSVSLPSTGFQLPVHRSQEKVALVVFQGGGSVGAVDLGWRDVTALFAPEASREVADA